MYGTKVQNVKMVLHVCPYVSVCVHLSVCICIVCGGAKYKIIIFDMYASQKVQNVKL